MRLSEAASVLKQKRSGEESLNVSAATFMQM